MSGRSINNMQVKSNRKPLNVILDLDSTCIYAVPASLVPTLDPGANELRYFDHYEGKEWLYRIYERPYLQDFLKSPICYNIPRPERYNQLYLFALSHHP